ncbi:hypothetical protein JYU18_00315 [bacterium AH-315-E07]|nr:hypothetical protein [bacterium AH-315-E07]
MDRLSVRRLALSGGLATASHWLIEVRYTSFDDKGIPITSASKGFDMATNMVA